LADEATATGTGTRIGVVVVAAEWVGWLDIVLGYIGISGAIPSRELARWRADGPSDWVATAPEDC